MFWELEELCRATRDELEHRQDQVKALYIHRTYTFWYYRPESEQYPLPEYRFG
jgi:hypothetical protein